MTDRETVNLPDLLGAITSGERVNMDVVQVALGVRPRSTPAGRPFDVIVLLQNAADIEVDVAVQMRFPDRDSKKTRNPFVYRQDRVLVGMHPAEVGYLVLPVNSNPRTAPGAGYKVTVELTVKRAGKDKPRRVRDKEGGGLFVETELPEVVQEQFWGLQQMVFSVERAGKAALSADFTVAKTEIGKVADLAPRWHTLWTMRDHVDEGVLVDRVRDRLEVLLPLIKRDTVYFPLLDAVQTHFRNAGYPLRAGEAVFIAKAMMVALEQSMPDLEEDAAGHYPEWFIRTCRILFEQPEIASNAGALLAGPVFQDLLRDAIHQSFMMVSTVTGDDCGGEAGQEAYRREIMNCLNGGMDFAHAYLPLVMGGLIVNTRVTFDREQPLETVGLLDKALQLRAPEQTAENQPIFKQVENLIDRSASQAV